MLLSISKGFTGTLTDRDFLKRTLKIAVPIAFQGLLNTSINMLDTVILGSLGENTIAAVGLANKVFFVFALLVFGISSGSSILAAQFWGNGDKTSIKKILGIALIIMLAASVLFVIPSFLFPETVMRIFTNSEVLIPIGGKYLKIACLTYPFAAISNIYTSMLRATGKVKWPVAVTFIALIADTILTYGLIHGVMGFPRLGVMGAAYGTLFSRILECVLMLIIIYVKKTDIAATIKEMLNIDKNLIRLFIKTAMPVIVNEFIWGLGVTMYSLVYGRMGDLAVAAITITGTIQDIVQVVFQGTCSACAVVLGHEMGAGRLKKAKDFANKYIYFQVIVAIIAGSLCILLRWQFISLFDVSAVVAQNISKCLIVTAIFMPFKTFNWIMVVGILRSGGDTKYCLFLDTAGIWVIGLPLAFVTGLIFYMPIYLVLTSVMLEEIIKVVLGLRRYKKEIWLKNLNVET